MSALEYYHLTDEIPAQIWVMVPEPKRLTAPHIKLLGCRNPQWSIGIYKTKNYRITTIQRTLIDSVVYKRLIGHQVALNALKRAVLERKVKLGDLYDLAKKMHLDHRLKPYIELLGS